MEPAILDQFAAASPRPLGLVFIDLSICSGHPTGTVSRLFALHRKLTQLSIQPILFNWKIVYILLLLCGYIFLEGEEM